MNKTNRVIEIITDIQKSKGIDISNNMNINSNLRLDLNLSSFDLAELTVTIEDEFGIDIFENGIVNTIKEIIEKLEGK